MYYNEAQSTCEEPVERKKNQNNINTKWKILAYSGVPSHNLKIRSQSLNRLS